jgi:protein-disulfide isomerase
MTSPARVVIEIQFFRDCPNAYEMINRVKTACISFHKYIDYRERLVETSEMAQKLKFRGSPTVLINGTDLMNLEEPVSGTLACRYYPDGLPDIKTIENQIRRYIKK